MTDMTDGRWRPTAEELANCREAIADTRAAMKRVFGDDIPDGMAETPIEIDWLEKVCDHFTALAAQPSAGAQGEVVAMYVAMPLNADGDGPADDPETVRIEHQVWDAATNETLCVAPNEASARRIASIMNATPAQPDTGSHGYGWNEDMTRLPAALTLIFRDPADADGCEMVRFGLSTDAMNATAWSYLPGVAQPDTGDVDRLHPATSDLIDRFAAALKDKLAKAEAKYGYRDGWRGHDWQPDLVAKLVEHVHKGDPRDVAAYCAFAWHHGWSITPPDTGDVAALREALKWLEWARPKAVAAMEERRFSRVRAGHHFRGTFKSGVPYVGLHQSEADEIEESAEFIENLRNRLAALSKPNAQGREG